jgi:hypothetical protein
MTTATKRRRTTAPAQGSVLSEYMRAGYLPRTIGGVTVIHTATVQEGGETFVTSLLVELVGQPNKLGIVQAASTARDRWMVSDGDGWLDAEFGTILHAVEALHNPKTRAAMRRRTDLRAEIAALTDQLRAVPAIRGESDATDELDDHLPAAA